MLLTEVSPTKFLPWLASAKILQLSADYRGDPSSLAGKYLFLR
jgi:hypothetical protein